VMRTSGLCQVIAGAVATGEDVRMPQLFMELAASLPEDLVIVSFAVVREVIARTVERVELAPRVSRTAAFASSVRLASSCAQLRIALITCALELRGNQEASSASRSVIRALAYMQGEHTRADLTLEEVARSARVSRWHLERLLKRCTGLGYLAHVRRMRVSTARRILAAEGSALVKEVASLAGFSSVHTMERQFRRELGKCPSECANSGERAPAARTSVTRPLY
jgi:AraC-like DNA-binding protein